MIQQDLTDEQLLLIADFKLDPKIISPAWFYDQYGSELFDQICELDEYYPTRTEVGILQDNIDDIVSLIGPLASIIEFGSGSSQKIRILLEHLHDPAVYVPVDISEEHLLIAAANIVADFPDLDVMPVVANFMRPFDLPTPKVPPRRNVVYFPGSTIGNFKPDDAAMLLDVMAAEAKQGGALLIGVDLKKDRETLERAYNDEKGVTAKFNINILNHLNSRFDSNFDTSKFVHRAIYNEPMGRVEMHLVSLADQSASILGETLEFSKDEYILTECSHKYTLDEFSDLASRSGFVVKHVWTDSDNLFSVQYLELQ